MKKLFKFLIPSLGFVCLLASSSFAQVNLSGLATSGIEQWTTNHPEAAQALTNIASGNTTSIKALAAEDAINPQNMSNFVTWATTNGSKGLTGYAASHKTWAAFNDLIQNHKPMLSQFADWCKANPQAALNMVKHPSGGLSYLTSNYLKIK